MESWWHGEILHVDAANCLFCESIKLDKSGGFSCWGSLGENFDFGELTRERERLKFGESLLSLQE